MHRVRHPFKKQERETFWALNDLSFEVKRGEVLGVIGRNGAGKSTLLKVLSSITEPTRGEVDLYGRVGSLLEVGTGFHGELTGRENIFLSGAILGMRRAEITRLFDEIVDFAGVEQFLDTPVKRYSSGMYVRLAFAVAAHLNPEIMIVDEVLAVGDAEFQKKCLGKMRDVASGGHTVFLVSHHMQSISALCTKAMFLDKGTIGYFGEVSGAIRYYAQSFEHAASEISDPARRPGSGEYRFTSVTPAKEYFECGEEKTVRFKIQRFKAFGSRFVVACTLVDSQGSILVQCDSQMVGHSVEGTDHYEGEFTIRTPWLRPGDYRLDMFICCAGVLDKYEHACSIRVIPLLPYPVAGDPAATALGVVFPDFSFRTVCNGSDASGDAVDGFNASSNGSGHEPREEGVLS